MHFEVLVEDKSGSITVEIVLEKILGANGTNHTWTIHPYKGIGRLPRNLHTAPGPVTELLLNQLPRVLRGYGRSLAPTDRVIVVVDLDNRNCTAFKQDLMDILNACNPRPATLFRIAIEETEAWLLGDRDALRAAYPAAKNAVINGYVQDSICGTWEVLADAIYKGGAARLRRAGYPLAGKAKCEWAAEIASRMDVNQNSSMSFQVFRDGVRALAGIE